MNTGGEYQQGINKPSSTSHFLINTILIPTAKAIDYEIRENLVT